MNKLIILALLLSSSTLNADTIDYGVQCSYGAPISNVYQQQDSTWVIQVYGGMLAPGGSDLVVNESQLKFKGFKGTKTLNNFQLGWKFEDGGYGGRGNNFGQCDFTQTWMSIFGQDAPIIIIKK